MFPINPLKPGTSVDRTRATGKKKSVSGDSLFSGLLGEAEAAADAAPTSAPAEVASVAAMNPMLGLQEVSDEEVQLRQAVKQGRLTLDVLDDLRDALLSGTVPTHMLSQIERLVQQQRTQISDPRLTEVLDEIELRAAVEMAKLHMAKKRREV